MKSLTFGILLVASSFVIGCQRDDDKAGYAPADYGTADTGEKQEEVKLVKTASIESKVVDVAETVRKVSALTRQLGGMVFHQHIASTANGHKELRVSDDSLLVISTVTPQGRITARIPSQNLEEFLYRIADLGYFTSNSLLDIDDKTSHYLRNKLKQSVRKDVLQNTSMKTSKKPTAMQTIDVRDDMIEQQLANRQIDADVNYSEVTISLYQNALVRKDVVADHDLSNYTLPAATRLSHAVSNGWTMFMNFIVAIAHLWVFMLAAILGLITYKSIKYKAVR
jgi:hypothetical protein